MAFIQGWPFIESSGGSMVEAGWERLISSSVLPTGHLARVA